MWTAIAQNNKTVKFIVLSFSIYLKIEMNYFLMNGGFFVLQKLKKNYSDYQYVIFNKRTHVFLYVISHQYDFDI